MGEEKAGKSRPDGSTVIGQHTRSFEQARRLVKRNADHITVAVLRRDIYGLRVTHHHLPLIEATDRAPGPCTA